MSDLFQNHAAKSGPVECLGKTFPSDEARREHYLKLLAEKLKDPAFRKIEGFPLGSDEDILALSDPPYYTACPNPFIEDFVRHYGKPYDSSIPYSKEPFAADVSEGKNDPIYNAHSYHTKVPHKAIMRYIDHYTKPGDLILDGFCGTGMTGVATAHLGQGRSAVLIDLSPIATFIARNLNGALDAISFSEAARKIVSNLQATRGNIYRTNHTGWKVRDRKSVEHKQYRNSGPVSGEVEFVLYSDVVACPNCGSQHPFYSIAVDEIEDSLRSSIKCPSCGLVAKESAWEASYETLIDPVLKVPHKQAKAVPVLINYTVGTSRFEKLPDEDDFAAIRDASERIGEVNFPIAPLIQGKETQRNVPRGITHLHHFFTPRELHSVALLLESIKGVSNSAIRDALLFSLTACLPYASRMRRFRADRKGGGPLSGTLYVGSLITPPNVFKSFLRNAETIASSLAYQRTTPRNNVISTQSSTELRGIPDKSIDYVFVDPPFGSNFDYSELNFFWESMLQVITVQSAEAIVSSSQEKALDDYRNLLTQGFKEFFRVLKPGRWMTVEFSNTQASVWNSIQSAFQEAGFVVANVSALDKKQGSFKAVMTTTAVKQDLVISAYKPNGGLEDRFISTGGTEDSAWDFVRTHLSYLPTVKTKLSSLEFIAERDPRIIFDRMVSWFVRHSVPVPMSTQEFQAGLSQRFVERDGMIFLPEQVAAYDKKRASVEQAPQIEMFVSDAHALDADDARKWRDHPAQFWLERAITSGLPARGGSALKTGDAWRVKWVDGSESTKVCFDARTAEQNPDLEWVTLEDPRARAVISELSRCVAGQPLPVVKIAGLPEAVQGVWSLWEISLSAEGLSRKRFLPVFATDDGRTFVPTAKRIWDLLLTEAVAITGATTTEQAVQWFEASMTAAKTQGERLFSELLGEHRYRLKEERERAKYAFEARYQAIGRIGLPAVREHRRKRLNAEHQARMAALDDAEASVPDLNAVMMLRVGSV